MLRLLIDENIDHRILRGLTSRLPELDSVVVQQVGLGGAKDSALLAWALENNRTIVTHDIQTMRPLAEQLLERGERMAGLILVPDRMAIGQAIEDLELMVVCYSQSDLVDQIRYLPL